MRIAIRRFVTLAAALAAAAVGRVATGQDTVRVSVDSSGAEADARSLDPSVSADGWTVVFTSEADDLVANDRNHVVDVFAHDWRTGTTVRTSVDSGGNEANGWSYAQFRQAVSGDGTRVVFESAATNLDPNDANGAVDVFVRDLQSGTTQLVSIGTSGLAGNGRSNCAAISRDGRSVVFESLASDLVANDTNGGWDIFLRDLASGTTERISVDSAGNEGNGYSYFPSVSADGRFVAFQSAATNLVAGDVNGCDDVFVRDRGNATTELASVDSGGAQANSAGLWPSISGDGALVAFQSSATNLVAGDDNQRTDVFLRDRGAGTTVRVSVDSSGAQADGDSIAAALDPDGGFVAFTSWATNLVAGDTNHGQDVFVRELATGAVVCSSVDSAGAAAGGGIGAIAAGGVMVVFESAVANLDPNDTNGVLDVFVRDACGLPTWTNYGSGFPGTNGVPALTAQQFPTLGATITVDLANSYGQPTLGFLVLGLQRASLPTKWGGDLLVLPALIVPISFSFGADSFTGTIPDDDDLCGVTVDLQGIEFDPGAQFGMSFSQGLELVLGS